MTSAAVGTGLSHLAALFALGLGCAYPTYEERELWDAVTVAPSMIVLMGYSFVVIGGTIIGLGITWFGLTGTLVVTGILIGGRGVYLLLSVDLPVLSYWYSQRRYQRYVSNKAQIDADEFGSIIQGKGITADDCGGY